MRERARETILDTVAMDVRVRDAYSLNEPPEQSGAVRFTSDKE